MAEMQTGTDALIIFLAEQYLALCDDDDYPTPNPSSQQIRRRCLATDDNALDAISLGLAVLAICRDHSPSDNAECFLKRCARKTPPLQSVDWLETLPWELAIESENRGLADHSRLLHEINHHQSGIRLRLMEYAWLVRDWLTPNDFAPALFENLADKLGHLHETAALCFSLFGHNELFFKAADEFKPEPRWEQQFRSRISQLKEIGFSQGLSYFREIEINLLRICVSHLELIKTDYIHDIRIVPWDRIIFRNGNDRESN